jgi:hypothetical protein
MNKKNRSSRPYHECSSGKYGAVTFLRKVKASKLSSSRRSELFEYDARPRRQYETIDHTADYLLKKLEYYMGEFYEDNQISGELRELSGARKCEWR